MATSLMDRHMAATIRLKLIMESAVSREIRKMKPSVPGIRVYPRAMAARIARATEMMAISS